VPWVGRMATELSLVSEMSSRRESCTAGLLSARLALAPSDGRWVGGAYRPRPDERDLHGSTRLGQAADRKASAWSATH
jgi:hypothetical protein